MTQSQRFLGLPLIPIMPIQKLIKNCRNEFFRGYFTLYLFLFNCRLCIQVKMKNSQRQKQVPSHIKHQLQSNITKQNGHAQASIKIQTMMKEAAKIFTKMLQDLTHLYETNGINYNVEPYYGTLVRLLSPYELMSHFHIVDNQGLFKAGESAWGQECRFRARIEVLENQLSLERRKTEGKRTQKRKSQQMRDQNEQNWENQRRDQGRRSKIRGFKPVLEQKIETQIANWLLQQFGQNHNPRLKDIAEKAKQLGRHVQGFKSTIGWVKTFLRRHPYLQKMKKYALTRMHKKMKEMYYRAKENNEHLNFKFCEQDEQMDVEKEQIVKEQDYQKRGMEVKPGTNSKNTRMKVQKVIIKTDQQVE